MSVERHPGDLMDLDFAAIELRVLSFYNTNLGALRLWHAEAKEECLNALTSGSLTGRRPSEPEFQRYP